MVWVIDSARNKEMWGLVKASALITQAALDGGSTMTEALGRGSDHVISVIGGEEYPTHKAISEHVPVMGQCWLESGFPCVEVSARLASSLMCTGMSAALLPEIHMPWLSFSIRMPEELLGFPEVLVVLYQGKIYTLYIHNGGFAMSCKPGMSSFADKDPETVDKVGSSPFSWPLSPGDRGKQLLLGRLILGVCIEMTRHRPSPDNESYLCRSKGSGRGLPTSWVFRLTRPVKVDTRAAVKEWLGGQRGGKLSMQSMVHGHHKLQPCGPGNADRKWIHVEPYWRGDPDAPIAVRPHEIG